MANNRVEVHIGTKTSELKKAWMRLEGFVAQRFHNYMILKVLIIFDPKLNLFKSVAYIFMQQSLT